MRVHTSRCFRQNRQAITQKCCVVVVVVVVVVCVTSLSAFPLVLIAPHRPLHENSILTNSIRKPFQTLRDPKHHWRWVFVASFGLTVSLYVNILNPTTSLQDTRTAVADDVPIASWVAHLLGGFLVGLGTKLGNGCTTGHGICGIGRWSPRSFAATGVFTGASMLSTYVVSPLRKWAAWTEIFRTSTVPSSSPVASSLVTCVLAVLAMVRPIKVVHGDKTAAVAVDTKDLQMQENKTLGGAISGIMCAAGLAISGMTKNSKVHDFLCLSGFHRETFDPTLVTVLCSAIGVSWLSYQFVHGFSTTRKPEECLQTPVALPTGSAWCVPSNTVIDTELLVGACIFGLGWGLVRTIYAHTQAGLNECE